ncbi:hypothetical protein DFH08DRAFT_827550 [Mycena albidolilacea]|uniref:Uncharacterized protein n=1 Tax=Mycena albidolilacea TaxID=1033008 RepID=A0AAD6YYA4_9AGAR|nr:hypothetical protein DFH08DRAFT_827550 [Mycena albidolilacea]
MDSYGLCGIGFGIKYLNRVKFWFLTFWQTSQVLHFDGAWSHVGPGLASLSRDLPRRLGRVCPAMLCPAMMSLRGRCNNETNKPVWGGSTPWRPISQPGTAAPSSLPPAAHSQPRGAQDWAGTSSVCDMTPSHHGCSVSFESPIVNRHHARGNPVFFDDAVAPTPNHINCPPQCAQSGLSTDQLLFTLLGKMDAVLDENRNLVNCVGELTHRVTLLEQGVHAPQAGRRRGLQRGRVVAHAPSTRRSVLHHSPSSEEFIDPVLRGVEALDGTSETTADTATGSEFSDDADDSTSTTGNDNEGPVVIDDETLTKAEKKALRISQIFRQFCNVFGKEWPDVTEVRINPVTSQQYPTPNFAYDVLNIDNCALFRKDQAADKQAIWPCLESC